MTDLLQQRAQIEYDRRDGRPPALLEIHWDPRYRCPVVMEGEHVLTMADDHDITLRQLLAQNYIRVEHIDGVVFGDPFDGELLECRVEDLPLCQLTIRAPLVTNEYVYEASMETVMDDILEEIDAVRSM